VPRVDPRVPVAGFEGAHARILAARFPEPRNDATFHALLEILAWVGAIRDRCKDDGLPRPDVLEGLYYRRNIVIHQGADVLAWVIGAGAGPIGSHALGLCLAVANFGGRAEARCTRQSPGQGLRSTTTTAMAAACTSSSAPSKRSSSRSSGCRFGVGNCLLDRQRDAPRFAGQNLNPPMRRRPPAATSRQQNRERLPELSAHMLGEKWTGPGVRRASGYVVDPAPGSAPRILVPRARL
jgi:hypothetical protein